MMAQKKSPFPDQYSGFLDCLLKVPRQEGFLALYKVRTCGRGAMSMRFR
jgi:hypothetical protein